MIHRDGKLKKKIVCNLITCYTAIQVAFCFSTMNTTNIYCLFYFILCTYLYVSLCQSVTLFLFMYMQFFILSLHWKYTICILVNIIRETNPISLDIVKMYKDKEVKKNVKDIFLSVCDVKIFLTFMSPNMVLL